MIRQEMSVGPIDASADASPATASERLSVSNRPLGQSLLALVNSPGAIAQHISVCLPTPSHPIANITSVHFNLLGSHIAG